MSNPESWQEVVAAVEHLDLAALRALSPGTAVDELFAAFPELRAVEAVDDAVAGPGGPVSIRTYRLPDTQPVAGFVWVHGGGFIFGSLDMDEAHWVSLALAARGIVVVSVDYRMALNGVHFPAPSDDVLAAWSWAIDHASDLGITAERLHIGGASAGGNLVAGVAKRLRDGAGPMPASIVLLYPLLHPEAVPLSEEARQAIEAADVTISPDGWRACTLQFVGDEALFADAYAFAGNGDVGGQPPVYILNSEADQLRSSGERYAEQLRAAGVVVRCEYEPGTVHGQVNEPLSEGGQRSLERIAAWLHAGGA